MIRVLLVIQFLPFTLTTSLPKPKDVEAFIQQKANDLAFGQSQLEQFVRDRPDTAGIIRRNSMLRWVLIWEFAGDQKRGRIYWDHREPTTAKAKHSSAYYGYPVLIQVSKNQAPVDQCAALLFELLNSEADLVCHKFTLSFGETEQSKDEFIARCVRAEFNASLKVQWFFIHFPIKADTRNAEWYLHTVYNNVDFQTYFDYVKANHSDYIKHIGRNYDSLVKDKR